jgi:hypothetical protein
MWKITKRTYLRRHNSKNACVYVFMCMWNLSIHTLETFGAVSGMVDDPGDLFQLGYGGQDEDYLGPAACPRQVEGKGLEPDGQVSTHMR